MKATITSFGFSKGEAPDTDHRVDVRFMESPPAHLCIGRDGTDPKVSDWVLEHGVDFFAAWADELGAVVAGAEDRDIEAVSIGVGCKLGQHRSVATAVRTGEILSDLGVDVAVEHRELDQASEEASAMGALRKFPKAAGPFWEVKAAARAEGRPTATDIFIYDVIGDDWWDPSLTAKELVQRIAAIETDEIVLHFNSPGGSMSDGIAIYNALITHPAKVTSVIEGWTGSIATVVALAGEHIAMFDNTMFMIHHPWGVKVGNAAAMREYADYLDRCSALMQRVYLARATQAGKTSEELVAALDAETYLDAAQAAEWGFVDEVLVGEQAAAALSIDVLEGLGFGRPRAAGRTLSAANEGKLRDAAGLIDEVLSTLDARTTDPDPSGSGDGQRTMNRKAASVLLATRRH